MKNRTNIDIYKEDKKCDNCPAIDWCKGGCLSAMRLNSNDYETLGPGFVQDKFNIK